jgi:hypothetical protein
LVFFSRAGDNYFNGGRKDLTVGNTEVVGGMVRNALRCDVFQIEALDPRRGSERSRFLREDPGDPIYADVAPFRFALGDHLDPAIRDHLKTGHSQIRVIWVEPRSSCRCTCCHRVAGGVQGKRASLVAGATLDTSCDPAAFCQYRSQAGAWPRWSRGPESENPYGRIRGDHVWPDPG